MFFRIYKRVLSPMIHSLAGPGFGCRFEPTCSNYASDAFRQYGLFRGLGLTVRRVCKCHPWGSFGYDPVKRG